MTIASLIQVVARYVFDNPLSWTEEFSRFAFIWVSYLSAWLAWRYRAHIALGAVDHVPSARLKTFSARMVEALVLALCLYTLWTNARLIGIAAHQPSAILRVPMGWIYAGYSAMALMIALDVLLGWITGRTPPSQDPEDAH
nr:TRAP transporter small permease [Paracoccus sp. S-4012]